MNTPGSVRRPAAALAAACVVVAVVLSGCSSSSGSSKDGKSGAATKISITLTPDGCAPSPSSAAAGLFTFEVTNKNASAVTEAELTKDGTIVGEKEDLAPGLSGDFSLRLTAGKYVVECPNAKTDHFDFTVTDAGAPASDAAGAASDAQLGGASTAGAAASDGHHDYVVDESHR